MGNTNHFEFPGKLRRLFIGLIAVGLVAAIIGKFANPAAVSSTRIWANFLVDTMFFLGMGLMGLFFVATHTMAYGGWQVLVQRIPEALSTFIPVGVLFLLVIVLGANFGGHHLYHWTDTFITEDSVTVEDLRVYEAGLANHSGHDEEEHHDADNEEHSLNINSGTTPVLTAQVGHEEDVQQTTGTHVNDDHHDPGHEITGEDHAHGDASTEHGDHADHDAESADGDHGSGVDHSGGGDAHGADHASGDHGSAPYDFYYGKVSKQGEDHGDHSSMYAAEYDGVAAETQIANPHFDALIAHKKPFLNKGFWSLRFLIYAALWIFFAISMRRLSLRQDKEGGIALYKRHKVLSGAFMVVLGVTSSTMAWDFLMSIDSHWFSTMYGWYTTVSLWVATIATTVLIVIYLKSQGYMPQVNENHLHDLGKYLFGFSVFWTYLWFSQYMLIWYANLPEETFYFHERNGDPVYRALFFVNLGMNFLLPFGILLTRGAKRRVAMMSFMALSLVFSHWLDIFLGVMPGTVGDGWAIGLLELGMLTAFAGIFLLVVFTSLSRASLVPQKHPFYLESVTHET